MQGDNNNKRGNEFAIITSSPKKREWNSSFVRTTEWYGHFSLVQTKRSPKKGGKLGARVFVSWVESSSSRKRARNHLIQSLPNLSAFWKNVTNDKRFIWRLEKAVLLKIIPLVQVKWSQSLHVYSGCRHLNYGLFYVLLIRIRRSTSQKAAKGHDPEVTNFNLQFTGVLSKLYTEIMF